MRRALFGSFGLWRAIVFSFFFGNGNTLSRHEIEISFAWLSSQFIIHCGYRVYAITKPASRSIEKETPVIRDPEPVLAHRTYIILYTSNRSTAFQTFYANYGKACGRSKLWRMPKRTRHTF